MKSLVTILALGLLSAASGHCQQAISTLVFSDYSRKTKMTTYSVAPLGSVSFAGKWRRGQANSVSRQDYFLLGDSLRAAIAINRAVAYPFYRKGLRPDELTAAMYEWDSNYMAEKTGLRPSVVKTDTVNHFIVWKITAADTAKQVDVMYLFGMERGVIYNLSIVTDRWNDTQRQAFLEATYATRKTGTCCGGE